MIRAHNFFQKVLPPEQRDSMSPNQFSDLINGDIDLNFLIQFRDDMVDPNDSVFGKHFKNPDDQISVRPWHETVDWYKREQDLIDGFSHIGDYP